MFLFLIGAPGFMLFFWGGDFGGAFRMDLLGLQALVPMACTTHSQKHARSLTAAAFCRFCFGMIGYEINVLLVISFCESVWMIWSAGHFETISAWLMAVLLIAWASFWFVNVLLNPSISDLSAICVPLLDREFKENFCTGALQWSVPANEDLSRVFENRLKPGPVLGFLVLLPVVLLHVFMVYLRLTWKSRFAILAAAVVPIVPLFLLGVDWGRWLAEQASTFILLALTSHGFGHHIDANGIGNRRLVAVLLVALFVVPAHVIGAQKGAIFSVAMIAGQE